MAWGLRVRSPIPLLSPLISSYVSSVYFLIKVFQAFIIYLHFDTVVSETHLLVSLKCWLLFFFMSLGFYILLSFVSCYRVWKGTHPVSISLVAPYARFIFNDVELQIIWCKSHMCWTDLNMIPGEEIARPRRVIPTVPTVAPTPAPAPQPPRYVPLWSLRRLRITV